MFRRTPAARMSGRRAQGGFLIRGGAFMKRFGLIIAASAVAIAIVVVSISYYVGRKGSSGLENWIGRQVLLILRYHITPEVSFAELDYQAPRTVRVSNLTFTAEGRRFLNIPMASLELAEVPRRGEPIRIAAIDLGQPQLSLILQDGNQDGQKLVGWSDFVRGKPLENPDSVPEPQRLSEVLELRHVAIRDGELIYETGSGESDRMTLPGIDLELKTPPLAEEPGWHALVGQLRRDNLFDVRLNGRINLDTGLLVLEQLDVEAALGERQYSTLPPALQAFVREHEIQGALTASGQGRLPLAKPAEAAGTLEAKLSDARVRFNGAAVPVESLRVDARLPDGGIAVAVEGIDLQSSGNSLASIAGIEVGIAGIPEPGQPLHVQRIALTNPQLRFTQTADDELAGWPALAQVRSPSRAEHDDGNEIADLADSVRLDQLVVENASVTYATASEAEPLTIDDIHVTLESSPPAGVSTQPAGAGTRPADMPRLMQIRGRMNIGQLLEARLSGRLDTRKAVLDLDTLQAETAITPETYDRFPPRARRWLREYDVRGKLEAHADGSINLATPQASTLDLEATLADAQLRHNDVTVPIKRAVASYELPQGEARISLQNASMSQGDLNFLSIPRLSARLSGVAPDGLPRLDQLTIERPSISVIMNEDGTPRGWEQLFDRESTQDVDIAAVARLLTGPVDVTDAEIHYESPAIAEPIALTRISASISNKPAQGAPLALRARISHPTLFSIDAQARYSQEAETLLITQAKADARLDETQLNELSRGARETLQAYPLRGTVSATWDGTLPIDRPADASGRLSVEGENLRLTAGNARFQANHANLQAPLPDGPVQATAVDLSVTAREKQLFSVRRAGVEVEAEGILNPGHPVVVRRLSMLEPRVLISSGDEGLSGWNQLAESLSGIGAATQPADESAEPADAPPQPGMPLPVVLEQVRIQDGTLVYDSPTGQPFELPGIDATLQMQPIEGQAAAQSFDASVSSKPLVTAQAAGRIDMNEPAVRVDRFRFSAQLAQAQALPPEMGRTVADLVSKGNLQATGDGVVPLDNPRRFKGQLSATLQDAFVHVGENPWSINKAELSASADGGAVSARYSAAIFGGRIQGTIDADLVRPPQPVEVRWQADNIDLEELSVPAPGEKGQYAGKLASAGTYKTQLANHPQGVSGNGTINIREGKLVKLPVIQPVLDTMLSVPLLGLGDGGKDHAEVAWTFQPDRMQVKEIAVETSVAKLRGDGAIQYDGALNLVMKAEVLEKFDDLTKPLGKIGDVIRDVRDLSGEAVAYKVRGTLDEPKVSPAPLGLGAR